MAAHRAGLGFRVHSGWACLVAVAGGDGGSLLIERKRLELIDPKVPSTKQPYHAAREMPLAQAEAFLKSAALDSRRIAAAALKKALAELAGNGCDAAAACILLGSGRPTDDLGTTLKSHAMIHTAEGHFFRNVAREACEACGVMLTRVKEKELVSHATQAIRLTPDELQHRLAELGKRAGPPWREDEKLCTIAGWLALVQSGSQIS